MLWAGAGSNDRNLRSVVVPTSLLVDDSSPDSSDLTIRIDKDSAGEIYLARNSDNTAVLIRSRGDSTSPRYGKVLGIWGIA